MIRTSTWENVGTESHGNYMDLLKAADLDYTVIAEDSFVEREGSKIMIPNQKVVLREDTNEVLGTVSSRYQLCQNHDALDFVEYLEGVSLIKAGSNGGMVWMIGKLPEVEVLGDVITPHLIFQNSHDGSCSIKTTICMLRMICQNQFIATFKDSPATITIRHQGEMEKKLISARETMQGIYNYVKNYDKVANDLVTKKVTPKKFNEILEGYFKVPEEASERSTRIILDKRERFLEAYNADDNQNFKGTKWGIINAFSDFSTHEEYVRKTDNWQNSRFLNSLSPASMTEFMKFIEAAA